MEDSRCGGVACHDTMPAQELFDVHPDLVPGTLVVSIRPRHVEVLNGGALGAVLEWAMDGAVHQPVVLLDIRNARCIDEGCLQVLERYLIPAPSGRSLHVLASPVVTRLLSLVGPERD